jgi:hypothetical protein
LDTERCTPAFSIFEQTSAGNEMQEVDAWNAGLFVTQDYQLTITDE